MRKIYSVIATFFCVFSCFAQAENSFVHDQSDGYVWPTDSVVLEKLDNWQDKKFGVLFHWGLYSVPGIVESWSICSEDWITRRTDNYQEYKNWYWGLMDEFNPVDFNPEEWADIMEDAGMKYMIFTTKHHDGFCMFDTDYTDFSIANGPFKDNPKKDVAKHVFDAFRDKDFMIGAYFSKPDWHSQWFWNDYYATPNRRINYRKDQHPDWWQNYVDFTKNQMEELTTDYGNIDILWLDGGWITGDEVGLNELLPEARKRNPGMISVDRVIKGPNENYQTPERGIPSTQLNHPWESCIPLADNWGYVPGEKFKSPRQIVNILSEIVAKGGCFVLGVGPTPQGTILPEVATILSEVGDWLETNGKAIYNTRTTPLYNDGNLWFTADKDGETLYAIYSLPEGDELPEFIEWTGNVPTGKVKLLENGKSLSYSVNRDKVKVKLPKNMKKDSLALQFKKKNNVG